MLEKISNLDRRIIFLFIAFAVALPLIFKPKLPMSYTPAVRNIFEFVENLEPGSVVVVSGDYDPGSMPELYPMNLAIVRHLLKKDLKIITMNLWAPGAPLSEQAIFEAAEDLKAAYGVEKTYGEDFIFLGYKVGGPVVIDQLGNDIATAYPLDTREAKPIKDFPLMKGITNLKDVDLVVSLAAGSPGMADSWVPVGQTRYNFPLAGGCTAVSAPELYPFLDTGQLTGLMAGLKGAAEYENLLVQKYPKFELGSASAGMASQSIAHIVIVIFIIIGNVAFFMTRNQSNP